MISRSDFEQYLKTIDTSEYEEYQKKWKKIGNIILYSVIGVLFALVTATVIIGLKNTNASLTSIMLYVTIFAGVVLGVFASVFKIYFSRRGLQKFDDEFRDRFIAKLFEGYSYTYDRYGVVNESIFARSGFSSMGDRYEGQDFLSIAIPNKDGTPSATRFNISDVEVTETNYYRDRDGHTQSETIVLYKGSFGYVSFADNFRCALGLNAGCGARAEKRISLEDVKFNKTIRTFTDNELEARVLLDPVLMQKLLKLDTYAGGLKIKLNSNEGFLSMRRDIFESRRKKGQTMAEAYASLYDDAYLIMLIIEEIRKNDKKFKI